MTTKTQDPAAIAASIDTGTTAVRLRLDAAEGWNSDVDFVPAMGIGCAMDRAMTSLLYSAFPTRE